MRLIKLVAAITALLFFWSPPMTKRIKRFKWKLDYALAMRRLIGMPLREGWQFATNGLADDSEIMDFMDGDEAAFEELSCWYD